MKEECKHPEKIRINPPTSRDYMYCTYCGESIPMTEKEKMQAEIDELTAQFEALKQALLSNSVVAINSDQMLWCVHCQARQSLYEAHTQRDKKFPHKDDCIIKRLLG